jgi:predicted DNA binding CopG/RHH family protein
MKRQVPRLTTDEEAEAFLEQDLSDLDFSQFKPVRFEFEKKAARVNMRLPEPLLAAVKARQSPRHPLPALHPRGPRRGSVNRSRPLSAGNFGLGWGR